LHQTNLKKNLKKNYSKLS